MRRISIYETATRAGSVQRTCKGWDLKPECGANTFASRSRCDDCRDAQERYKKSLYGKRRRDREAQHSLG